MRNSWLPYRFDSIDEGFLDSVWRAQVRRFSAPDNLLEHERHPQLITGYRKDSSHEDYNKARTPLYTPVSK